MKKAVRIGVPILFYLLLVVFLVLFIRSTDWSELKGIQFNWAYFAAACVTGLVARYWSAYIWIVILRSLGAKSAKYSRTLVYVFAKSWLGRYIPGTAPYILGKIYFASKQGISRKKLAVSSLLEAALQVVVQLALAISLLFADVRLNRLPPQVQFIRPLMFVVLIACLIAILPPVFNRLIALAYRLLRRGEFARDDYASWKTIGQGAGLYVVGAVINGLSLFLIAKTVDPALGINTIFYVMGLGTLAGVAGMLIVFAPGGLGVREFVQLPLLTAIMPAALAGVVVLVSRLWSLLMDVLFFATAWLAVIGRKKDVEELVSEEEVSVPE